jgi:O-antigen ligase
MTRSRISQAVLLVTLAVYPVIPGTTGFTGSSFVVVQRVLVALLLVAALLSWPVWKPRIWRLRVLRAPAYLFIAFLGVGVLSAILSPLPKSALGGVLFYVFEVGAPFVAACLLAERAHRELYLVAISAGCLVAGLIAVVQYLHPSFLSGILGPVIVTDPFSFGTARALGHRVSGPFPHPVSLGAFCALVLPFVLSLVPAKHRLSALLGVAATLALTSALILSQTRLAIIGAGVGCLVWIILTPRRKRVLALAAVGAVLVIGVMGPSTVRAQAQVLWHVISYSGQSSSTNPGVNSVAKRKTIYRTGWRAFQNRPWLGYGMRVPTSHYDSTFFQKYGNPLAFESYAVVLPLEVGAIGALIFGSLLLALGRAAWLYLGRIDRAPLLAALACGAVLAIGANLFQMEIAYLWMLIGLALGYGLRRATDPSEEEEPALAGSTPIGIGATESAS